MAKQDRIRKRRLQKDSYYSAIRHEIPNAKRFLEEEPMPWSVAEAEMKDLERAELAAMHQVHAPYDPPEREDEWRMLRAAERDLKYRSRENPAMSTAAMIAVPALLGGGVFFWMRKRQRDDFEARLRANPPFSLGPAGHDELVNQYVPWFSTVSADDAWTELVGHPETWTEWASRYVPGLTSAREVISTAGRAIDQITRGGANRAQEAKSGILSWFR